MATKIETIYNRINTIIQEIKEEQVYANESVAFGHFIIKHLFGVDDQTARESITDGGQDNGIDAIYVDEKDNTTVHFFQFKFPKSIDTIGLGYTDSEIKGLGTGVQHFLMKQELKSETWNEFLLEKHLEVRELDGYSTKMWVVRYTNSKITHQENLLKDMSLTIEDLTLNSCSTEIYGAKKISELFERIYEKNYPTIKLKLETGNQNQIYEL